MMKENVLMKLMSDTTSNLSTSIYPLTFITVLLPMCYLFSSDLTHLQEKSKLSLPVNVICVFVVKFIVFE